ncbi:MAG: bifunctional folylpolyglutamate synthase/dihydrofolate synthase [Bacteroidales bacterium]|nr:bifunctional folylpolyglutamate synthase/dihydrofolate synthase [Bacteroidales bacterium]
MQYEKKIQEIFERHPSVQVNGFSGRAYKAGIEGMTAFDAALGHPWKAFRCIHVAGTNGKGSVSSMLAASLASTGLRVGLYTSPHLLDFRERIKIIGGAPCPQRTCHPRRVRGGTVNEVNGGVERSETSRGVGGSPILISKQEVLEFLDKYEKEIEGLSFFEITTGMALSWFKKEAVDVAVIEVGLGGRLDSTNVITPELSVVTSIGLDHCSMLGDTRAEIALEKAGIFKKGVPAVVWGHDPETDEVFADYAKRVGAELHFADEMIEPVHIDGMDLRGEYQDSNVRTTLAALQLLGMEPDLEAIRNTARITGLRGRWEILRENPTVICDIGHNPPALAQNFRQLEESGRELIIVYGVMADKALDDIAPLMPARARYILCAPDSARALPVAELYARLGTLRPDLNLQTAPSVRDALDHALSLASPDTLIYVGGSTFVVAEIIK